MNITATVNRNDVKYGEFWNCCDRNDATYAGAFDADNGETVWHALCDSCAHTYARTVRGSRVAYIIDEIGVGDIVRHRGHNGKFTVTAIDGDMVTGMYEYYRDSTNCGQMFVTQPMLSRGEYIPNWTVVMSRDEQRAMRDLYPIGDVTAPF